MLLHIAHNLHRDVDSESKIRTFHPELNVVFVAEISLRTVTIHSLEAGKTTHILAISCNNRRFALVRVTVVYATIRTR